MLAIVFQRLLQFQVLWHVLLVANSAQSLAASESLGRPSCRFQVSAKYLQVEDTCKSKHLEGDEAGAKCLTTISVRVRKPLAITPGISACVLQQKYVATFEIFKSS